MLKKSTKTYIDRYLRKVFGWSKQYKDCQKRAHIDGEIHRCEGCNTLIDKKGKDGREEYKYRELCGGAIGANLTFIEPTQQSNTERVFAEALYVDHIDPYCPTTGWYSDDHYLRDALGRMFPGVERLQYLCHCCHYLKTQIENDIRRLSK